MWNDSFHKSSRAIVQKPWDQSQSESDHTHLQRCSIAIISPFSIAKNAPSHHNCVLSLYIYVSYCSPNATRSLPGGEWPRSSPKLIIRPHLVFLNIQIWTINLAFFSIFNCWPIFFILFLNLFLGSFLWHDKALCGTSCCDLKDGISFWRSAG